MPDRNELERTIEYALRGTPELKADEKRIWLGEFRERVILGLTMEQTKMMEAQTYVEAALKDDMADILIVNQNISMEIMSKYMALARDMNKEFKTVATDNDQAMGLVVVSRQPADRQEVIIEIQQIPEKFKAIKTKEICKDCYEELATISPDYANKFKKIGLMNKVFGVKCPVCDSEKNESSLM